MTTIANIFILLCLAAAVATANHYRRRWTRAEDTNRFLVEQINQLNERIERLSKTREKIYMHSWPN